MSSLVQSFDVFSHICTKQCNLISIMQGEGTLLATGSYDGQARIWSRDGRLNIYFSAIVEYDLLVKSVSLTTGSYFCGL